MSPGEALAPGAFRRRLALVAAVGLAIRVAYILLQRRGVPITGDSFTYHDGANLLADGEGFIEPFLYRGSGLRVASADHPPLYTTYLAVFSLVGLTQATAHMLASALLGTATVVLIGSTGRRLGGDRIGLIAAALAAVYPNFWSYDGFLLSETMAQFCVAVCLVCSYRFWARPSTTTAIALGAAAAFGALARAELALLVPLVLWPLAARAVGLAHRDRFRAALAGSVVAGLIVAPWCLYNLSRFEHPVLISSGFQITLLVSSCDDVYYGEFMGYWSKGCVDRALAASDLSATDDRSVLAAMYGEAATAYIGDHLGRLPVVMAARVGRITGLYAPRQQAALDHFPSSREKRLAEVAAVMFLALEAAAVAGALILRRRRTVPLLPILAVPAIVVISVALLFAETRYRATAEPAVVLLAAVAIDAALLRWKSRATT